VKISKPRPSVRHQSTLARRVWIFPPHPTEENHRLAFPHFLICRWWWWSYCVEERQKRSSYIDSSRKNNSS
jgi:hypothetical protein